MIDISKFRYPELNPALFLRPGPQVLLGRDIYWTLKEDGSNVGAYLEGGEVQFRSRNMDRASDDIYVNMKDTDEYPNVKEFLEDAEHWGDEYVVFGELCAKGKSPARTAIHEKTHYIVFDIWSAKANGFMNYTLVHQHCHHFKIPCVELIGTCNVVSLDSLFEFRDSMLKVCESKKKEGTVGKTWGGDGSIYFKEKLDTPHIEKLPRKVEDGQPQLPPLPESEIWGAVDKVLVDLGKEEFRDRSKAMPLVAKYIAEECRKHLCAPPKGRTFFEYYKVRVDEVWEV